MSGSLPRAARYLAILLAGLALTFAAWGLARLNTWYLASDQFAFLTFARDLQQGRVFHPDDALALIAPLEGEREPRDALAQTYYWQGRALYSRYPPGFSALLAVAGLLAGEVGEHALNPALYLVVLCALGLLTRRLLLEEGDGVAAGAGIAAMWLLLLLPTRIHLWGITVARDLPAHLLALLAIFACVRGAGLWCGLALGAACSIRPDAALYALSLAALIAIVRPPRRQLWLGAAGFLIAVAPLLLYNHATGGHPLRFTQGEEFRDLLGAVPGRTSVFRVRELLPPSGGAFRLSNLFVSLPGNAAYLAGALGWLTPLTLVGLAWSLFRRRVFAAAFAPYPLVAVPFYSFWSHSDPRYLAGVALCSMPFAALGAALWARAVVRAHPFGRVAILLPSSIVVMAFLATEHLAVPGPSPPALAIGLGLAGLALGATWPRAREPLAGWAPLVPAVALAVTAVVLVLRSRGARDPFQRPEVLRARATVGRLVPRGSLVITSNTLGRPAENLRHYSEVEAFYQSELPLLGANTDQAAILFILAGRRVFFLLDARDTDALHRLPRVGRVETIEQRRGAALLEWYVDPRQAPRGAVLYELVIPPATQQQLAAYLRAASRHRRSEAGLPPRPDVLLP